MAEARRRHRADRQRLRGGRHGAGPAGRRIRSGRPGTTPRGAGPAGSGAGACRRRRSSLLPASPDGRDLAPRLAAELDRPLLAGAVEVAPTGRCSSAQGGLVTDEVALLGPVVATLLPGTAELEPVRTVDSGRRCEPRRARPARRRSRRRGRRSAAARPGDDGPHRGARASSPAGPGCAAGRSSRFSPGSRPRSGASARRHPRRRRRGPGCPFERQIGTTGVIVDPDLYVAFGISGAVQHVTGLGNPDARRRRSTPTRAAR